MYTSIPFMLLVGPTLGYFAGRWLESRYGIAPWGITGGVLLGLAAAFRAVLQTLQKQQKAEEARKKHRSNRNQTKKSQ